MELDVNQRRLYKVTGGLRLFLCSERTFHFMKRLICHINAAVKPSSRETTPVLLVAEVEMFSSGCPPPPRGLLVSLHRLRTVKSTFPKSVSHLSNSN